MSEQDTNSHDAAVANIEKMFGGGEEPTEEQENDVENESQETAQADDAGTDADGQEAAAEQSEDLQEVEIEGETYLIPKKISDKFITQQDYTRKTQEVAEMRRALTAEREVQTVEKAFQSSIAEDMKKLSVLDAQIEQFKGIDWSQIEDPGQLVRYREQLNQLKDSRAEVDQSIKAKRAEFDEKVKSATLEAIEAGNKAVTQKLRKWGDTEKQALFAYGLNEGYTRNELDRLMDPRLIVTMWKAKQWDELQASKPGLTKKAAQAAPVVKPGSTKRTPSRIQQLDKRFKEAKDPSSKKQSAEEYFTAKFGG